MHWNLCSIIRDRKEITILWARYEQITNTPHYTSLLLAYRPHSKMLSFTVFLILIFQSEWF
jgi:hypothetical protein